MIRRLKDDLAYFKKWYKHGTLMFVAIHMARIILFPVMLLDRLYQWVYYDD